MLPKFGSVTGNLPAGEHAATWAEVVAQLSFSVRRQELVAGLEAVARELRSAGATILYLDGSFATKKHNPSDFDGCYDDENVDFSKVDPVLLDFSNERAAMKKKYGGEVFPASGMATNGGEPYRSFFQSDKNGRRKGIVVLDLSTVP